MANAEFETGISRQPEEATAVCVSRWKALGEIYNYLGNGISKHTIISTTSACIYKSLYSYMFIYIYLYIYICMYIYDLYTCTYIYEYTNIYI